jgi:GxxExxY protein
MLEILPPLSRKHEKIAKIIVNSAYKVHKALGPGLLEKIYETCLEHELKKTGLNIKKQVNIPVYYDGIQFEEGLRLDILVEDMVIIEIKAVNLVNPVWEAQILSYLKLLDLKLGFLINFNVPIIKQGIKRYRL